MLLASVPGCEESLLELVICVIRCAAETVLVNVVPEAFADLDDIRVFIADGNPDAADRFISEIFDSQRALVLFPHQGHRRPDLTSRPLRFKRARDYLIAYARDESLLW